MKLFLVQYPHGQKRGFRVFGVASSFVAGGQNGENRRFESGLSSAIKAGFSVVNR
jgi:hypothetical protein